MRLGSLFYKINEHRRIDLCIRRGKGIEYLMKATVSGINNDLRDSEIRYRRLFEAAQNGILILDAKTGMIEDVNPYLIHMLGYSREEIVKKKLWEVGAFRDIESSKDAFEALQVNEYIRYEDLPLKTKDGKLVDVEFVSNVYLVGDEKVIQCNIRDNTEHKLLIAALRENEKKYHDLLNHSPDGYFIIELSGNILTVNEAICKELEFSEEELLSMSVWDIVPEQYLEQYRERLTKALKGESLKESVEYMVRGKNGGTHYVEVLSAPRYSGGDIIGFQGIARDITARKRAEEALRLNEDKYRTLITHLPTVVYTNSLDDASATLYVSPQIERLLGYTPQEWLADPKLWSKTLHPEDCAEVLMQTALADQSGKAFEMDYRMTARDGSLVWVHDQLTLVTDLKGKPQYWQGIMLDITERKRGQERIQRQLEHLTATSAIDRSIASSFDLKFTLSQILGHVTKELGVDAADILILDPIMQMLEYGAGRGFRTAAANTAQVPLGKSYAGRVALERRLVQIPNLDDDPNNLLLTTLLAGEDFVCYFGVPLITKGQVKGVLETFHRTTLEPDTEWFDFLNSLAEQAAIAIENFSLFDSLQRMNSELVLAYETTLEGWSRALDLRDKETEGHTQRVTEMAVELARAFGLSEAELLNVRRGGLLHDIGKMGVPDYILLKPGELTKEEWRLMRMHPVYAYDLLSHIAYLREALDIPYCHHEKWDGSGYPRGLKGDQIPLTARIFAVVDVWDAITSDRPYRAALTKPEALKYIQASSGAHFDPKVVDLFQAVIGKKFTTP